MTGSAFNTTALVAGAFGALGGPVVVYIISLLFFRLQAPHQLDEVRKQQLSDASEELQRERSGIASTVSTLKRQHAAELDSLSKSHERFKEASDSAERALKDEIARLRALDLQPRFRFMAARWLFDSQECDALELWNDGEPIDLERVRQASYIELSFAFDPSTPDADARFAASVDARYGAGFAANVGSLLEERFNPNYLQALARHEKNPLGFPNNDTYAPSRTDEYDIKYLVGAWDGLLMPMIKRLGIARRNESSPATASSFGDVLDERPPQHPSVRYIPSYYFHRRDYEVGKQPGKLATFYAWQDGAPGTNYTAEFARLAKDIYRHFGDKVTVSRRTFLQLTYVDKSGARHTRTFDVWPHDPWGALIAKEEATGELSLSMGMDIDMKRISASSLLSFCTVPPALRSLSQKQMDPDKVSPDITPSSSSS